MRKLLLTLFCFLPSLCFADKETVLVVLHFVDKKIATDGKSAGDEAKDLSMFMLKKMRVY